MEELELTFLAKKLPDNLTSYSSKEMLDIYIPGSSAHPILRIRRQGGNLEMTKKSPIDGDNSRQLEQTIPLTQQEYDELSTLQGKRITKTRYYCELDGITYEIDVFREDLSGLVLVDVEFDSAKDKDAFKMPDFCLADVTQEDFIAGGMLCGKKYQDIQSKLNQFEYNKFDPRSL